MFTLTSTAFQDGKAIPRRHAYTMPGQCNGENVSPPIAWSGVPAGTQRLALTVVDPDARNWVHWVQFDIPADATGFEAARGGPNLGIKGVNDYGELGYGGPCPPSGTHHYVFTLYALDAKLELARGATLAQLESAMRGHIVEQARLTGLYSKG